MTCSLIVMMLGVTELVLVRRAVVAGLVVRMGGGGGLTLWPIRPTVGAVRPRSGRR
jgi:hypothetical protein